MSYLAHTHQPALESALSVIEDATRGRVHEFKYVLVTGLSGIIPGAIFCATYDKSLIVLRKEDEKTHGKRIEGAWDWDHDQSGDYILLDDFICHGGTIDRLMECHGNSKLPRFVVLYNVKQSVSMCTPKFRLVHDGHASRFTIHKRNP